jgi:hypothetical protein
MRRRNTEMCRKLHNEEVHNCHSSPDTSYGKEIKKVEVIKARITR